MQMASLVIPTLKGRKCIKKLMSALAPLLGRTLIIVAHPDDEAVTCAALMQRMQEPYVLFCTDGAPLDPYFWSRHGSREAYSLLRQKEARLALSHLGVRNVEFLKILSGEHIIDQQLFQRLPEAIEAAFQVVSRVRPQALLTLAYEGGHPDHDSCNFITSVISRQRSLPAWEMPVYKLFHKEDRKFQTFIPVSQPAIALDPTADEIARKRQALEAYASQGDFLVRFDSVEESFRPLPEYDYARPAHEGELNYEAWQWSMTGKQVCAAFGAYLNSRAALEGAPRRGRTKLG
jgi:LmbE family N-acetylglucosaminyl deacetylase